jgi:hypothetical protein
MTLTRLNTALAALVVVAGLYFGLNFLLNPDAAAGFGITPWPTGNGTGYYVVKAARDISYALVALVLLVTGQRRALGWVVLVDTVIPLGDFAAVITHGGTLGFALAVHGSAAVLVAVAGLLLLRETSTPARV